MKGMGGMVIWYTFVAVVIYLLLINYKGANKLLGTSVGGYATAVRTLQGR